MVDKFSNEISYFEQDTLVYIWISSIMVVFPRENDNENYSPF